MSFKVANTERLGLNLNSAAMKSKYNISIMYDK